MAIFNRCLRDSQAPSSWKSATTVLFHKKGDPTDPTNFRPITLQSCLYKLLMVILSDSITRWALDNNLVRNSQKSARPGEGCFEHTFSLSSAVKDARCNQKNIYIAWLDLRNAFGSIPQGVVFSVLSSIGAPEGLISLLRDIYTGATTDLILPTGPTQRSPSSQALSRVVPSR